MALLRRSNALAKGRFRHGEKEAKGGSDAPGSPSGLVEGSFIGGLSAFLPVDLMIDFTRKRMRLSRRGGLVFVSETTQRVVSTPLICRSSHSPTSLHPRIQYRRPSGDRGQGGSWFFQMSRVDAANT